MFLVDFASLFPYYPFINTHASQFGLPSNSTAYRTAFILPWIVDSEARHSFVSIVYSIFLFSTNSTSNFFQSKCDPMRNCAIELSVVLLYKVLEETNLQWIYNSSSWLYKIILGKVDKFILESICQNPRK